MKTPGSRYRQLVAELIVRFSPSYRAARREVVSLRRENRGLRVQLGDTFGAYGDECSQLEARIAELAGYVTANESLSRELGSLNEKYTSLEVKTARLERDLEEASASLLQMTARLTETVEGLTGSQNLVQHLKLELRSKRTLYRRLMREYAAVHHRGKSRLFAFSYGGVFEQTLDAAKMARGDEVRFEGVDFSKLVNLDNPRKQEIVLGGRAYICHATKDESVGIYVISIRHPHFRKKMAEEARPEAVKKVRDVGSILVDAQALIDQICKTRGWKKEDLTGGRGSSGAVPT